jgi:CubicO group peptidase (beta-lactamase class C family)
MRKNHKSLNTGSSLILIFMLIITYCSNGIVQSDEKFKQVDKIFEAWNKPDSPGCSIAIIQNGKIIYARGYGMANLDYGIPNSSETVFRIGSTSKQFTAACIQILNEKGKLSLDDDIRRYVPEIPEYEHKVTIRHMIHHTSGIRDYLTLQSLAGVSDEANYHADEVVRILSRQKALNFDPGEEYLYSNSGYILLAVIVERVSGQSLAEFARTNIFDPLGMKNTHYHDDNTRIVKNRATGYAPAREGFRVSDTINELIGDGAVFTTVEDLYLWDQNFYNNTIVSPEFMRNLQKTGLFNSGEKMTYAMGLRVNEYRGLKRVNHGGTFVGFRADMMRFPDQEFTVICLANLSSTNPTRLCTQVAEVFLADKFTEEQETRQRRRADRERSDITPPKIKYSPDQLKEYTGDFFSEELNVTYEIRLEDNKLVFNITNNLTKSGLDVKSFDTLSYRRVEMIFTRDLDNRITGFNVNAGRVRNIWFSRVK